MTYGKATRPRTGFEATPPMPGVRASSALRSSKSWWTRPVRKFSPRSPIPSRPEPRGIRTGVQPVELATRILREMETGKTVGVREVWVPNRYAIQLSEPDREKFGRTEKAMRRELEQVVRDGAAERGWELVGPAEVTFDTD